MNSLLASRVARRRGIAFTVLLAVTLVLMAFSASAPVLEVQRGLNSAVRPIQGVLDDLAGGMSSAFGALGEVDRLRVDNSQLRQENERLTTEMARLDEVRRENELLAGLLRVRQGFAHETVAVEVIARDSSEFRQVVTVGKGTAAGIARGDVVIGAGGSLAGRVIDVGPNFASVLLISDPGSTVIGQLPSAATGDVRGQVNGVLVMSRIDSTEAVRVGDVIVTAGIELEGGARSQFPKALLIGEVVDVRLDPNSVVQMAFLAPAAPLDRLEWALVITDYEGGLGPVEGSPAP